MTSQVAIPLSYYVRKAQVDVATVLREWWNFAVQGLDPPHHPMAADNWLRTRQLVRDQFNGAFFAVEFNFVGWTPDSHISYGPEASNSDGLIGLPDHTYLFDNREGTEPLTVDLTEAVTYKQSRTAELDQRISVDIGSKITGTVGAAAEGGQLEASIEAKLGIQTDTKTATAEGTDRTQTEHIGTTVAAAKATLGTLSTPEVHITQPMAIDGFMDMSLTVSWRSEYDFASDVPGSDGNDGNWIPILLAAAGFDNPAVQHANGRTSVHFGSLQEFTEMLAGVDVDFPQTTDRDNGKQFADRIIAASHVSWSGQVNRVVQESSAYKFSDVTGNADEAIAEHSIPDNRIVTPAAVA